jgi:hypothetical protein
MWDQIVGLIESPTPETRLQGWTFLRRESLRGLGEPEAEHLLSLENALREEEDEDIWKQAISVLALLGAFRPDARVALPASPVPSPVHKTRSLLEWLWQPFHKPSVVFGLLDPKRRQRDELAKITLGRFLSFHEFPHTDFELVHLDDPCLGQLVLGENYEVVCLIGRPSLYEDENVLRWMAADLRFGFPTGRRPENLPPGKLDPRYHNITERNGTKKRHAASEKDGRRVDYGLVQRYAVSNGDRDIIVVVIAGASSLGTLAAVQWATTSLRQPICPDAGPLPAPDKIVVDSRLEALIEVHADATPYTREWKPDHVEVKGLFVDGARWVHKRKAWCVDAPRRITVVVDPRDRTKVRQIRLDGKAAPLRRSSQVGKLLIAVGRQAAESPDHTIDPDRLGKDTTIWNDGEAKKEDVVRNDLSLLKIRYLGDALEIGGRIVLHADFEEVAE